MADPAVVDTGDTAEVVAEGDTNPLSGGAGAVAANTTATTTTTAPASGSTDTGSGGSGSGSGKADATSAAVDTTAAAAAEQSSGGGGAGGGAGAGSGSGGGEQAGVWCTDDDGNPQFVAFSDLHEQEPEAPPPAPYYWEPGGEPAPSSSTMLWHTTHWTGAKVFEGLEFCGEVLANFFGLNQSKYQWAIDMAERQREEELQKALEDQQRLELALQAELERQRKESAALEGGGSAGAAE